MANEQKQPQPSSRVEAAAAPVVGLTGVGFLLTGIHHVHPPSALIVGGLLALAWAVLKSSRVA